MAELPTFDNDTGGNQNSDGSGNLTISFAVGVHPNRAMIVAIATIGPSSTGSATYAGASMNKIRSGQVTASGMGCQLFYLTGPATGTNNLTFSSLAAGTSFLFSIHTYYNCAQSSTAPDNSASNFPAQGAGSATLTPTKNNCLFWGCVMQNDSSTPQNSGFPNNQTGGSSGASEGLKSGDNGIINPASSQSASYTGTGRAGEFAVSLAPIEIEQFAGFLIPPEPNWAIDTAIEVIGAQN